jgi:hypothetical protein
MGVNQFTALTQEEFKERFLTDLYPHISSQNIEFIKEKVEDVIVDWTEKGAVGRVRSQSGCSSGFLFSMLDCMESSNRVATGEWLTFS